METRTSPPSLSADAGASYQRAMSSPMGSTSDNEGRIASDSITDELDPKDLPEVSQEDAEKLVDELVPEPPKEPIEQ